MCQKLSHYSFDRLSLIVYCDFDRGSWSLSCSPAAATLGKSGSIQSSRGALALPLSSDEARLLSLHGERIMMRTMVIALAAAAAVIAGSTLDASARMGGGMGHGGMGRGGMGHMGGFARGGFSHGAFARPGGFSRFAAVRPGTFRAGRFGFRNRFAF